MTPRNIVPWAHWDQGYKAQGQHTGPRDIRSRGPGATRLKAKGLLFIPGWVGGL